MGIELKFRRVAEALSEEGFRVEEYPGWEKRGRGYINPRGMVMHHTGHRPVNYDITRAMLKLLANGHGRLKGGPICNTATDQRGTIYLIASGLAWHAGPGGWKGLHGNTLVLGNEAIHTGRASEKWTDEHHAAQVALAAAMAEEFGFWTDYICEHKEWRSEKPDRVAYNGNIFRAEVRKYLEDGMRLTDEDCKRIAKEVWNYESGHTYTDPGDGQVKPLGNAGYQTRTVFRLLMKILHDVRNLKE